LGVGKILRVVGPSHCWGGTLSHFANPLSPSGGGGIQKSRHTPCWQSRPRRGWGFSGPLGHTPGENGGGSYPLLPPGVTFGGLSSPLSPGDSRQGWPPSSPLGNPKHTSRHEPRGRHVPPRLPLPSPLIAAPGRWPRGGGEGGRGVKDVWPPWLTKSYVEAAPPLGAGVARNNPGALVPLTGE
jgi:hypothetical protein